MKELVATARNITHSVIPGEDGVTRPAIEAILTLGEKQPVFRGLDIAREMHLSEVRFEMDLDTAMHLQRNLQEWIESAEMESQLVNGETNPTAASEGE